MKKNALTLSTISFHFVYHLINFVAIQLSAETKDQTTLEYDIKDPFYRSVPLHSNLRHFNHSVILILQSPSNKKNIGIFILSPFRISCRCRLIH